MNALFRLDFFDLIVVDECHRGSAADDAAWRKVLEYFSSATQIGLTPTPKETKEISNIEYFGDPIYKYSLHPGISDGFLAPYKVVRIGIDRDLDGWRPEVGQKRIVAKVDELMALCDRLESQQQERETRHAALARASLARFADAPTPASLNLPFHSSFSIPPSDLRKSILTLAVQGKLVPQESETYFGSLDSILAEASVNGVSKGPTFDKTATEILRISAGTSRADFYVNEDDFKHVDLPPDEIVKFQLSRGDLLACRFNGNLLYVGIFSYYRGNSSKVQVNPDKLIRFRIKTESHCPRYICLAMNAAPTRESIEAMCATTAGNIGLSAGKLKKVEIPLPPLAEQRRIVAKISELMALVDALETQLAASRAMAIEPIGLICLSSQIR